MMVLRIHRRLWGLWVAMMLSFGLMGRSLAQQSPEQSVQQGGTNARVCRLIEGDDILYASDVNNGFDGRLSECVRRFVGRGLRVEFSVDGGGFRPANVAGDVVGFSFISRPTLGLHRLEYRVALERESAVKPDGTLWVEVRSAVRCSLFIDKLSRHDGYISTLGVRMICVGGDRGGADVFPSEFAASAESEERIARLDFRRCDGCRTNVCEYEVRNVSRAGLDATSAWRLAAVISLPPSNARFDQFYLDIPAARKGPGLMDNLAPLMWLVLLFLCVMTGLARSGLARLRRENDRSNDYSASDFLFCAVVLSLIWAGGDVLRGYSSMQSYVVVVSLFLIFFLWRKYDRDFSDLKRQSSARQCTAAAAKRRSLTAAAESAPGGEEARETTS